ncbi:hypothetical protein Btru_060776 [Bulinus truncatus]|nr:hypothetical protein Btru_060776 [Bulinus truncatus]
MGQYNNMSSSTLTTHTSTYYTHVHANTAQLYLIRLILVTITPFTHGALLARFTLETVRPFAYRAVLDTEADPCDNHTIHIRCTVSETGLPGTAFKFPLTSRKMLYDRNISRSSENSNPFYGLGNEELCVMRYRLYYSTEIKNLTFHCDNGCCGRINKQYCCLSTPAFLGFIMTSAIIAILCLAAASNYIMNKCPSVPCSPVYHQAQWATASSGAPLYPCIHPHAYGFQHIPGYGYPLVQPYPYMGATPAPPMYPPAETYDPMKPIPYQPMMLPEGGQHPAPHQLLPMEQHPHPPAYPGTMPSSAPVSQPKGSLSF